MTSRELGYLHDIRDAAGRAMHHIAGLDAESEAAKGLADARAEFPDIDWSGMIGMRNILVHRYQEIDYQELWTIVNRDLEPIVAKLTAYLASHP